MEQDLTSKIKQFTKEIDQLVDSVLKLNAARHQVRMEQLHTQHARRIEKLLFESWISPYTSVQQWFDALSDEAKDYWQCFYVLYQYNPEFHAKLHELDFMQRQIFALLRTKDLSEQAKIFSPIKHLLITA